MIKDIVRIIGHLGFWIFVWIPLAIIGVLILSIVLLFVPRSHNTLPFFVRWFDNNEIPLGLQEKDDGLIGAVSDQQAQGFDLASSSYFQLYRRRLYWLGLRNPLNYFNYAVMGKTLSSEGFSVTIAQDDVIGNPSNFKGPLLVDDGLFQGFARFEVTNGKVNIYRYNYIKIYKLFGEYKMFEFSVGYKIYPEKIEEVKQKALKSGKPESLLLEWATGISFTRMFKGADYRIPFIAEHFKAYIPDWEDYL